mmetsp:Transcript_13412/g.57166  ORF Transcript_13412/g.57166 Transcript_13412/m.57166 type:complete len:247 (-) Transcript_13412:4279-5019(-)
MITTCTFPRVSVCARCARMRILCAKRRSSRCAERSRRRTARARSRRGATSRKTSPKVRIGATRPRRVRTSLLCACSWTPSASGSTVWSRSPRRWRCWRRSPPRATPARATSGNDCARRRRARRRRGTTSSAPSPGTTAGSRSETLKTRPYREMRRIAPRPRGVPLEDIRTVVWTRAPWTRTARCPRRTCEAWWRILTCSRVASAAATARRRGTAWRGSRRGAAVPSWTRSCVCTPTPCLRGSRRRC